MEPALRKALDEAARKIRRHYLLWLLKLKPLRNRAAPGVQLLHAILDSIPIRKRSLAGVLHKYDRMAGEYCEAVAEAYRQPYDALASVNGAPALVRSDRYFDLVADCVVEQVFNTHADAASYLEVGVGEYTTMVAALQRLTRPRPGRLVGLDISWSRVYVGERYARAAGIAVERSVVGSLFELPFVNDAFDVVYTHHCIEQSPFDNATALRELHRVARRYVILIEPSYELGNPIQKRRMLLQDYVRGLPRTIAQLGLRLIRYELLPIGSYVNCPAVFVLEKPGAGGEPPADYLACPTCKCALTLLQQHAYCRTCEVVYPILCGIPCLDSRQAICASRFAR